jgi:hypothetical protein
MFRVCLAALSFAGTALGGGAMAATDSGRLIVSGGTSSTASVVLPNVGMIHEYNIRITTTGH